MKKSLIALAVLAASGAAMAQSSVTLFGVVDTGVSYVKGGGNGGTSNYGLHNGSNSSSRLGVRGVEDLGGGLKAGFWLEGAIGTDVGDGSGAGLSSGSGFQFGRRSTVSLMGNFGEVRLGRDEVVAYNKLSAHSNFSVIGIGGFRGWGYSQDGAIRQNNKITYLTPNFSGFTAGVDYAFGEKAGDGKDGRYFGGFAAYNNGPLAVTLGADRKYKGTVATGYTGATADFSQGEKLDSYGLGATYDFGVAKVNGLFLQVKEKGAVVNSKLTSYALGVSAPVGGVGEVKAQYALYKNGGDLSGKAHQLSLGYVHNLSKRTALYGTYSFLKNKDDATFKLGGAQSYTVAPGKASNGVQVGIRHAF
ncbi:porin [Comamonas testosteroni]|uniref:Outer membrane porin protein 32 n=1 Tax=Comamonas testosteroni TaxID=285 RepID=A0A8B4RY62_COMTE|nr:porin [Comamonas testosteroni]EHN66735.1 gram-negative type outer membrane porin protein [Comamonas testosteroni ATCC 11996]QQN70415.1 porin [Comamonas testosteroni]SUY75083.1 Outer membrane porin protein 32 precursor [Comamonas testosteroni]